MLHYREQLGDNVGALDAAIISERHFVFAEFANDAMARKRWSIKRALIGSVVVDDGLYAISDGLGLGRKAAMGALIGFVFAGWLVLRNVDDSPRFWPPEESLSDEEHGVTDRDGLPR
jgi:hypothetical protein